MHEAPIPIAIHSVAPPNARPIAPISAADPAAFAAGVAAGANMTDDEVVRHVNGIIAAINDPRLIGVRSAKTARRDFLGFLDLLAECGMVASIGYAGTAIIRPLHREQVAA